MPIQPFGGFVQCADVCGGRQIVVDWRVMAGSRSDVWKSCDSTIKDTVTIVFTLTDVVDLAVVQFTFEFDFE